MSLRGKLAIVTGASSGIGRATAKLFAREGARVVATGRDRAALDAMAAEVKESRVIVVPADMTADGECARVVDEAVAELGGLTTLVNCAGVLRPGAIGADGTDISNFDFNFAVNTRVVFEMMTHATPHLKKAGGAAGASIVNVSSVNGLQSFGGVATYCAAKAATDMLARCAAVDLAPFGVRVNNVNPGLVLTELQKRGGLNAEQYAALVARSMEVTHPLAASIGRVAAAEEVGGLIAFLASDAAGFITGDCVKIDGGRACVGAR